MERLSRDHVDTILSNLQGYKTAQLLMKVRASFFMNASSELILCQVCTTWKASVVGLGHFWSHVYAWSSGKPMLVQALSGCDVVQVVASTHYALARGRNGLVWQWGLKAPKQESKSRVDTLHLSSMPTLIPHLSGVTQVAITAPSYDLPTGKYTHFAAITGD